MLHRIVFNWFCIKSKRNLMDSQYSLYRPEIGLPQMSR
jgi:hypothetical protein